MTGKRRSKLDLSHYPKEAQFLRLSRMTLGISRKELANISMSSCNFDISEHAIRDWECHGIRNYSRLYEHTLSVVRDMLGEERRENIQRVVDGFKKVIDTQIDTGESNDQSMSTVWED